MKFLLVIVVVGVALWLMIGRPRRAAEVQRKEGAPAAPKLPQQMVACAQCGMHLPEGDALRDPSGRPYCSDAHRQAGPRGGG